MARLRAFAIIRLPSPAFDTARRVMSCDCSPTTFPDGVVPRYDFTVSLGATFSKTLVWKVGETPAPVNLTGYTARMTMVNGEATFPLTTENGRIALGGVTGEIALTILAADTAGLTAGTWSYRLDLLTGATVYRFLEGYVNVPVTPAA